MSVQMQRKFWLKYHLWARLSKLLGWLPQNLFVSLYAKNWLIDYVILANIENITLFTGEYSSQLDGGSFSLPTIMLWITTVFHYKISPTLSLHAPLVVLYFPRYNLKLQNNLQSWLRFKFSYNLPCEQTDMCR